MTEITGGDAKHAVKQFRWFWAAAAVDIGVVATAWLVLHASYEQLTFLALGLAAWMYAGLVIRNGAIAFSFSTFGGKSSLTIEPSPLPRTLLAPVFALAGGALIIASTQTRIGAFLVVPVRLSLAIWNAAHAAWSLFLMLGLTVYALAALASRKNRPFGIFWLGLLAVVNGGAYLFAPAWYRGAWSSFLEPFHDLVNLAHGK